MTAFDGFDTLDRRIADSLEAIAEPRLPEYLQDVLRQTERTAQRRPLGSWSFRPMSRVTFAAMAGALAAILVGGALILNRATVPNVGASPSPSRTPFSTPLVTGLPAGMGYPTDLDRTADQARYSTWIAETGPIAGLPALARRVRLSIDFDRTQIELRTGAGNLTTSVHQVVTATTDIVLGGVVTGTMPVIGLVASGDGDGCHKGDFGRYSAAFGSSPATPDEYVLMELTLVDDACATRAALLGLGWIRANDRSGSGGRGIVEFGSNTLLVVTLPGGFYDTDRGLDFVSIADPKPPRTLIVVKDPAGFAVPCSADGGGRLPIAPKAADFLAYLRALPGFSVHTTSLTVDGRPAVRVTVPTAQTADCPSHRVIEWTAAAQPSGGRDWQLDQGDTDVLYLVEVGSDLYLLQWLGGDVTPAEEQSVIGTASWLTSLASFQP